MQTCPTAAKVRFSLFSPIAADGSMGDSFYPIFPVPLDLAHELSLDVTHSDMMYLTPQDEDFEEGSGSVEHPSKTRCAPDVLIVPSRLKHFSKVCWLDGEIGLWIFMTWAGF